jgi:nucleoside-diphosphate-sugar epimerase
MNTTTENTEAGSRDRGRLVTVFGGTGFLGRRLVRHLLDRGFVVRAASRHPDRVQSLFKSDGRFCQLSGQNHNTLWTWNNEEPVHLVLLP